MIVCGFSPPTFELPPNFTFFSIGKQEDYPVGKWSDGLLAVMDAFPMEKHFVLMLEDYLLVQPVRVDVVKILYEYMQQFQYVLKMDLCADRRFAAGVQDYGEVADIPLVKSDYNSPYQMSLWTGIWSRDLLKKVLIPGEDPWSVELAGTPRVAKFKDEMIVLGTKIDPWPIKHALIYRNNNPGEFIWDGFTDEDTIELKEMGY